MLGQHLCIFWASERNVPGDVRHSTLLLGTLSSGASTYHKAPQTLCGRPCSCDLGRCSSLGIVGVPPQGVVCHAHLQTLPGRFCSVFFCVCLRHLRLAFLLCPLRCLSLSRRNLCPCLRHQPLATLDLDSFARVPEPFCGGGCNTAFPLAICARIAGLFAILCTVALRPSLELFHTFLGIARGALPLAPALFGARRYA